MQGFQKDINFFDEIKEVLETEDYTSIWILTAFVNERAICNLMPSIKKSKADISFIIGIRNNVSTYQALKCLINMKVSVFVFDTARIESIFHAKVIVGSGTNSAKVICGSANITTGGLANNIEAGIISKLNLRCESDEKFLTEVREYIDNIIHNYPQNVKKISEDGCGDLAYRSASVCVVVHTDQIFFFHGKVHHSSYLQFIFLGSGRRLFRAGGLFAVGKLLADRWPGLANTHITALIFVNHGIYPVS